MCVYIYIYISFKIRTDFKTYSVFVSCIEKYMSNMILRSVSFSKCTRGQPGLPKDRVSTEVTVGRGDLGFCKHKNKQTTTTTTAAAAAATTTTDYNHTHIV